MRRRGEVVTERNVRILSCSTVLPCLEFCSLELVQPFGVIKSSPGLMNRSTSRLVLLVVERAVAAAEREELLVRAALDDLAVLEDEDLIGAADRRQAVRDDERRAALAQRSRSRPG